MGQPLLLSLLLTALFSAVLLAQDPVQIQFLTDPLLVQTGTEIVFTVLTVPDVLVMTWLYQDITLGLWAGGNPTLNEVPQFAGRITIAANQLRIGGAQLRDAGSYKVEVVPFESTGLVSNSRSIELSVFDGVAGVSLFVPSVAVEGRNISLRCTWTAGTEITVQWGKGGTAIIADSRITISGGSLVINPARRSDSGDYTCTVSNPVSVGTARRSLTVYYGPDTPVLTKDSPKECVGGGDVLAGQTVRLTCMSDSLPPALFTWQNDGETVASSQPDSGVLTLQPLTTDESGQYVCVARNAITDQTSEQGTDLVVVGTCLNVGEVVGIVIGCFLFILIILIILIICLVRRRRRRQRQRGAVLVPKTDNTRPIPPDPQLHVARDLGQGLQPPLYHHNTQTRNSATRESGSNPQTLQLQRMHHHNGHTRSNGLLHNAAPNNNSHNGIDNPAFTHTDAQNANTQPQNPNIIIHTGTAHSGIQPPAVQVSLNTLPQNAQPNNNTQIPTIHFSLNSHGQQIHQDNSFPSTNAVNTVPLQTQQTLIERLQSNPIMQNGQAYPGSNGINGNIDTGQQDQPHIIPTGYTHHNRNNPAQRHANTQTNQQDQETQIRPDRQSWTQNTPPDSSRRQLPWDLLRGTPAYPSGRRPRSPELVSDNTDYTTHPPLHHTRSQPEPQSRATSRSRGTPRRDAPSLDRHARNHSAESLRSFTLHLPRLESDRHSNRTSHLQRERESAQQDIRELPGSQPASRQEPTHRSSPQALPLQSQQASVGRSSQVQGPMMTQGMTAHWGADTRVLADPNHLAQVHMALNQSVAASQTAPPGLGAQTAPVLHGASQPRQRGTAPVSSPSAQTNPSQLTQAVLQAHTERAQTFQNRQQQTQAALLHPGPEARTPAAGTQNPPTPPPVIHLTQFQTLPRERNQEKSPGRGPRPPRPPANIPVAQRRHHLQQRSRVPNHPTMVHTRHHHHPGNTHVGAHRHAQPRPHGHPAHFTHPKHQQAHRGRPR